MLEKTGIHIKHINIIKDMYEGAITSMKIVVVDTEEFPITNQHNTIGGPII